RSNCGVQSARRCRKSILPASLRAIASAGRLLVLAALAALPAANAEGSRFAVELRARRGGSHHDETVDVAENDLGVGSGVVALVVAEDAHGAQRGIELVDVVVRVVVAHDARPAGLAADRGDAPADRGRVHQ